MKNNLEASVNPKKKWRIVVAIIAYTLSALAVFGIFAFQSMYEPVTNANTTGYTGTIRQISPVGSFTIYTHEQDFPLYIVIPNVIVDESELMSLSVGDSISFKIRDIGANSTINGIRVHVVYLSVGDKEIITLKSVNVFFAEMKQQATIGFGVMSAILFVLATLLLLWYLGVIGKKKLN